MTSYEEVRELFRYDPETGDVYWRVYRSSKTPRGAIRSDRGRGYYSVRIMQKQYALHRIIWLWMTGEWPKNHVDHINGNPSDNRWCNLREATPSQNQRNHRISSRNTSGFKGVHRTANGKWRAMIRHGGKKVHIGIYDKPDEAYAAYCEAAKEKHGEFANFG